MPTRNKQGESAAGMGLKGPAAAPTTDREEIARLAYTYWEERRGENGTADDDWFRAERELHGAKAERSKTPEQAEPQLAKAGAA